MLAFELEEVPPVPRHDALQIVGGGEGVQQRIDGRVEGQEVDDHERVNVNCGGNKLGPLVNYAFC